MQVRYLFNPDLSQVRSRLAARLLPGLAEQLELKAECSGPRSELNTDWRTFYPLLSRPLLQPRFQIVHAWPAGYTYHPLQWNILLDPPRDSKDLEADEIWVFSEEAALFWRNKISLPVTLLPLNIEINDLQTEADLPLELEEPQIVLASLDWQSQEQLKELLKAFLLAFNGNANVGLALHLNKSETQESDEEELLALVLKIAAELNCDPEQLNMGTWIGPLERSAYLALLHRADVLLMPSDEHAALEALALGKNVWAFALQSQGLTADTSPESLRESLRSSPEALLASEFRPEGTIQAMIQRMKILEQEVDFARRDKNWQAKQEQHQQAGRKQQYSLFHSDYNDQEMQARRQWHQRYARYFETSPGDVLDIGCGSGIFLEIMRDLGTPAFGLDPDPDMVTVCQNLGLQAISGDERLLSTFQSESLGGIHASHVIEHIDGDRAIAFVEGAKLALRPGGCLVIRTPNWRNESVRHEGFWLDITHIRPYPLALLKQVLEDVGFDILDAGFEDFGWNDTFIVGKKLSGEHA